MSLSEAEVFRAIPSDGFLKKYVDYAMRCTDAHASYHLGTGLAALAMSAPMHLHVPFGTPIFSNLYALNVGASSKSRKSSSITVARDMLKEAIPSSIGEQPGSREALVDGLKSAPRQVITYSEFGAFLAATERGYLTPLKTALTEAYDCLSGDTEVLAERGWVGAGVVKAGDRIWTLNRDTGRMELAVVTGTTDRITRAGEQMLALTSKRFDVRVTEGHDLHGKYRREGALSNAWVSLKARDLPARKSAFAFPLAAEADFPGVALSDDDLRFLAWFLTDGSLGPAKLEIAQTKPERIAEIRALLQRLGFDFHEYVLRADRPGAFANARPGVRFVIPKGTHGGQYARNGWNRYTYWLDKKVAPALHGMTRGQFKVFWAGLLAGDGDGTANHSGVHCNLKEQADAYSMMATLRGFAATVVPYTTAHGTPMWRVSARDQQWLTFDPGDARATAPTLTPAREGERVWCLTTRNGTLVTRRNGKIVILGNCSPISRALVRGRGTETVAEPRLSLMCGCTVEFLERHTEPADWTGGFMARFLTFYADRERTYTVPPGDSAGRLACIDHLKNLNEPLYSIGQCLGFDREARAFWDEWSITAANSDAPPEVEGAVARAPMHGLRIALLLAWDYGQVRSGNHWYITMRELEPARAIADLHIKSVLRVAEHLAPTRDMRERRDVLRAVKANPRPLGVIVNESKLLLRRVKEIIETLMEEGQIVSVSGVGKGQWFRKATAAERAPVVPTVSNDGAGATILQFPTGGTTGASNPSSLPEGEGEVVGGIVPDVLSVPLAAGADGASQSSTGGIAPPSPFADGPPVAMVPVDGRLVPVFSPPPAPFNPAAPEVSPTAPLTFGFTSPDDDVDMGPPPPVGDPLVF